MNTIRAKTRWFSVALCLALMSAVGIGTSSADVPGQITKTSKQKITGQIRWQPAYKQYVITTADNVLVKVSPREVAGIRVKIPENLEKAANLVSQGKQTVAIPELEKIVKDYAMLQWDVVAGKYLIMAHLKNNDAKKAAAVGGQIVADNPEAGYNKDLAPPYWEALVATEKFTELRKLLDEAAGKGEREVQAIAMIRRGDMDRKKEKFKEALVDGYLRVAYFYRSQKAVQPEALYKGAECFQALGQHAYAEKLRKRLLSEYPNDPYTARVRAGS